MCFGGLLSDVWARLASSVQNPDGVDCGVRVKVASLVLMLRHSGTSHLQPVSSAFLEGTLVRRRAKVVTFLVGSQGEAAEWAS